VVSAKKSLQASPSRKNQAAEDDHKTVSITTGKKTTTKLFKPYVEPEPLQKKELMMMA